MEKALLKGLFDLTREILPRHEPAQKMTVNTDYPQTTKNERPGRSCQGVS
jgi:hypothetical protein